MQTFVMRSEAWRTRQYDFLKEKVCVEFRLDEYTGEDYEVIQPIYHDMIAMLDYHEPGKYALLTWESSENEMILRADILEGSFAAYPEDFKAFQ